MAYNMNRPFSTGKEKKFKGATNNFIVLCILSFIAVSAFKFLTNICMYITYEKKVVETNNFLQILGIIDED